MKGYAEHQEKFKELQVKFNEIFETEPAMKEFFDEAKGLLKVSYEQRTCYQEANAAGDIAQWRSYRLRGSRMSFEDDDDIEFLRAPVKEAEKLRDNKQARGDLLMKFQDEKDEDLFKHWQADSIIEKFQVHFPDSFKVKPTTAFEYICKVEKALLKAWAVEA